MIVKMVTIIGPGYIEYRVEKDETVTWRRYLPSTARYDERQRTAREQEYEAKRRMEKQNGT